MPSLRQEQPPEKTQEQGYPVSFSHQAEGSSLMEKSEWRQAHAWGGRQSSALPSSSSQVLLYNRYEALDVEG